MIQFESVEKVAELCEKEKKEYVVYKNNVYDISKFIVRHPGGKAIIQKEIGKTIDEPFDDNGHSASAKSYFGNPKFVPQVGFVLDALNQDKLIMEIDEEYKKSFFCSRKYVVKKLVTKEDPIMLHKTLGFLSLASFLYRYFYVLPMTGNLGFDGTWFDYATLALHLCLSCSSMIFHVLAKRIQSRPLIIWNEYRLHTITFTARCVNVALFSKLFPWERYSAEVGHIALFCMVMAHHLVVDQITRVYGEANTTTVRGKKMKDGSWGSHISTPQVITRAYAGAQLASIAFQLLPCERLMDFGFNALIGIQSSAFLMTLFRKGLIRWYSYTFWYSLAIVIATIPTYYSKDAWYWIRVVGCYQLRLNLGVHKYVMWAIFLIVSLPCVEDYLFTHFNTYRGIPADMGFDSSAFNMFQVPSFAGKINA